MGDSDKNLPQETEPEQMTKEEIRRAKEKLSATRKQQKQREKNLKLKRKQLERRRAEKEKQKKKAIDARRQQEKLQKKREKKLEGREKDKQEFLKKEYRRAAVNKRKEEERIRKKMKARAEKRKVERQYALEAKLVAMGKIPARPKGGGGHGFFWNVFAVCAAFFIGVIAVIGGIVGGGYYALSKVSVDQLLSAIGLESSKYISSDYASSTLLDLGKDLLSTSFENLNSIGKYTPIVENTLEKADGQFADMGISFNVPAMMDVPFGELGSYIQNEVLYKAELGKALGVDGNTGRLVVTICYGKKDKDYTVDPETNKIIPIEGGREPVKVGDLASSDSIIGDLAVEDIMDIREESPAFLKATASWTIDMLGESHRIDRLKIKQILELGENPTPLMEAIADWRIQDLTDKNKMDSLLLGNVIEITENSPKILRSLQNTPIGKLGEKVDELLLSDILDDEDMNGNKILRRLKESTLISLSDDLAALTIEQVFGNDIYSYRIVDTNDASFASYEVLLANYTNGHNTSEYATFVPPQPTTDIDPESVSAFYYNKSTNQHLRLGYSIQKDDGKFYLVNSGSVKQENTNGNTRYYILQENTLNLTPVYEYKRVNYATGALEDITNGEIRLLSNGSLSFVDAESGKSFPLQEDDFSQYYINAEEERIDLDIVFVKYTDESGNDWYVNEDGQISSDGTNFETLYTREDETGTTYYTIQKTYVNKGYYPERSETKEELVQNQTPIDSWIEESALVGNLGTAYKYTPSDSATPVQLERYLRGIWYLLLNGTDATTGTAKIDTPVLEMNNLISDVSDKITKTPLWELYFHGLLSVNPYQAITSYTPDGASSAVTNLNDLTVEQVIGYIKSLNTP